MVTYLGDSGRPNNKMMTMIAKINWTEMGSRHAMAPPAYDMPKSNLHVSVIELGKIYLGALPICK
jgi:hypothetical protein